MTAAVGFPVHNKAQTRIFDISSSEARPGSGAGRAIIRSGDSPETLQGEHILHISPVEEIQAKLL